MTSAYSRFIVYVDEAGDHGPASPEFPVFVLAFCIFDKMEYANTVTSYMHRLKFKHVGHDALVLHEREIRKSKPPFDFLQNAARREEFMADLDVLVRKSPFTLVAAVIDKPALHRVYKVPPNPYHLAMEFGLERIERYRSDLGDTGKLHVLFEGRGKVEDADLELQFRRVCQTNELDRTLDLEPVFVRKDANHCGLQLADLIARPIGRHVMNRAQANRAYDIIETKFRRSPGGKVEGWGLKVYP